MDFAAIAGSATAFLAPFIPILAAKAALSFEEAVKKFGAQLGEATWKRVTAMWTLLTGRVSSTDSAASKVRDALPREQCAADDPDWNKLRYALEQLMKSDAEFARTFGALVSEAQAAEPAAAFSVEKQIAKYIVNAQSISRSHIGDKL
ncbi:MAG: hypothetical protein M9915_14365 [Rhizobacter sp.]|nr:hypothetical protein [Rhizobacter sp.]